MDSVSQNQDVGLALANMSESFYVTSNPLANVRTSELSTTPKNVTTTRIAATPSTASVDTASIKISLVWVVLAILVVVFNCYLSLMATELVPIRYLVNFVKGSPVEAEAEARLMIRHSCSAMHNLMQILYGFVFVHNPYKPIGAPQLTVLALGITSRALLAKVPGGVNADSHEAYSYGYMYILDSVWTPLSFLVIYRRSKTIKSKFTSARATQYVFNSLPKVVFSTIVTLLFLIGESMSCLASKARDNVPHTMEQCDDVVGSNYTLMTWFTVFAFSQLGILPFMESNYTMADFLRFDFTFAEQVQILFAGIALGMAIFVFASSQDSGYGNSDMVLSTKGARDTLNWTCKFLIYAFILLALLFFEREGNTATHSTMKGVMEFLRGHMRTRSRVAFAPFIRGVLVTFSLFFLLPGICASVMACFDKHVNGAKRAEPFVFFGWMMSMGFAALFAYSTPKGKQAAEDGFFVGIALTNAALSIMALSLLDEFTTKNGVNLALFVFASATLPMLVRVTRTYIAMHSDAHIEEHLIKSAAAICGLLGPAIFLFAETASCYNSEEDYDLACGRLRETNFTIAFHLLFSAAFYLGTGIVYRHLSTDEILSLRNVDAGFLVRGLLQASAWMIAMVMFGSRPRDEQGIGEGEAEVILTGVAKTMKYAVALIWIILCVWEYFLTKHKVHTDLVLSGEREEDEGGGGWVAQFWSRMWGGLNESVKKAAVDGKKARISPLYLKIALVGAWYSSFLPVVVALVAVWAQGKDSNIAFLFLWLSRSSQLFAATLYMGYMLLDLEPDRRVGGINTYLLAVAACIRVPVAFVLGEGIVGGEVGTAIVWVCFGGFFGGIRRKASAHPVEAERYEHVIAVCSPSIVKLFAPLIVMGSEMAVCWVKAYLESTVGEGGLMKDDPTCEGIYYGCDSLLRLIVCITALPVLTVNAKATFNIENICRFKLGIIEAVQIGALGVYCVYGMGYYATRQERRVDNGAEVLINIIVVCVAMTSGMLSYLKKGGDSEGGETSLASRQSSLSSRGSDIVDRISVGARKSVWDGGMRGATGMGRIKRASTRGIENESRGGGGAGRWRARQRSAQE